MLLLVTKLATNNTAVLASIEYSSEVRRIALEERKIVEI